VDFTHLVMEYHVTESRVEFPTLPFQLPDQNVDFFAEMSAFEDSLNPASHNETCFYPTDFSGQMYQNAPSAGNFVPSNSEDNLFSSISHTNVNFTSEAFEFPTLPFQLPDQNVDFFAEMSTFEDSLIPAGHNEICFYATDYSGHMYHNAPSAGKFVPSNEDNLFSSIWHTNVNFTSEASDDWWLYNNQTESTEPSRPPIRNTLYDNSAMGGFIPDWSVILLSEPVDPQTVLNYPNPAERHFDSLEGSFNTSTNSNAPLMRKPGRHYLGRVIS